MTIGRRRAALTLLGLVAAIGVSFALGRATAHASPAAPPPAGTSTDYANGFQAGRSVGVQEGRALQEGQTLTGADHDAATAAFASGYVAGINDAFGGYDGGWSMGAPYLVTLDAGTGGATYRIASRTGMQPGVSYFVCPGGSGVCQEPR